MLPSEQASEVVRQRGDNYGHPIDDFSRTAALWNAWLGDKLAKPLVAEDVAMLMVLLKSSRLRETIDHPDSIVDVCGYANTLAMVLEARKRAKPADPPLDLVDLGAATPEEQAEALYRRHFDRWKAEVQNYIDRLARSK